MLRPSRPMMRPFRSSLGRSTTETVVSIACSAALRWMASAMICCARTRGRLARLGLEPLDEVGGVAPRVGLDLLQRAARAPRRRSGRRPAAARAADRPPAARRAAAAAAAASALRASACSRARRSCSSAVAVASRSASARVLSASVCSRRRISWRRCALLRSALGGSRAPFPCALERRFLAQRLGVALGLAQDALGLALRAADGLGGDPAARLARSTRGDATTTTGDEPRAA